MVSNTGKQISIIDGNKSIDTLHREISETLHRPIPKDTIHELLYGTLFKKGMIDNNPEAEKRNSSNYLALKFILIPKKFVIIASSIFSFLFIGKKFFRLSIVLLSISLDNSVAIEPPISVILSR
jgi:hypothetical protein